MHGMKEASFFKNITVLVSGTMLAQMIPILLQPLLKRLFSPEQFGVFDIYLKIIGILFVLYAMKYDLGIVLPKNRVKSLLLLSLSVVLSLGFTLISLLFLLLFDNQILVWLKIPEYYQAALYLIPFSTLFYSIFNALNYLLIREKNFKAASYNKVSRRLAEGGVQVSLFYNLTFRNFGLFIGDLIGNIVYAISAYYQAFRSFRIDGRLFRPRLLISVAKEYRELPLYNIIPELLNAAFFAALSFLVLSKFDIREVGFMELTQRILAIPSVFIAYSTGQVLLQRVTELVNNKKPIFLELKKTFSIMALLTGAFIIGVFFLAVPVFSFVFGNQWAVSGEYSKYLVFFYAAGFLVSPFGQILNSLRKFKQNAMWKILRFVMILPLFFFEFASIDIYLIVYAAIGSFSYVVYFLIIYYQIKKYEHSLES